MGTASAVPARGILDPFEATGAKIAVFSWRHFHEEVLFRIVVFSLGIFVEEGKLGIVGALVEVEDVVLSIRVFVFEAEQQMNNGSVFEANHVNNSIVTFN